jgi:hypothetical protein
MHQSVEASYIRLLTPDTRKLYPEGDSARERASAGG